MNECIFCGAPLVGRTRAVVIDGESAEVCPFHVEGIPRPKPTHPFTPNRWNPERCERCEEKKERHAA